MPKLTLTSVLTSLLLLLLSLSLATTVLASEVLGFFVRTFVSDSTFLLSFNSGVVTSVGTFITEAWRGLSCGLWSFGVADPAFFSFEIPSWCVPFGETDLATRLIVVTVRFFPPAISCSADRLFLARMDSITYDCLLSSPVFEKQLHSDHCNFKLKNQTLKAYNVWRHLFSTYKFQGLMSYAPSHTEEGDMRSWNLYVEN